MACEKFRAVKHQFLATIFGRNYTIRYLLHIILSTVINFFFLSLSEHFVLCSGLEYGMVIASTTVVDVETKSTGRWSNIDGHGRLDWVISINWCSNGMLDSKLHIQLHWLQENHPAKWHTNHGKFSQIVWLNELIVSSDLWSAHHIWLDSMAYLSVSVLLRIFVGCRIISDSSICCWNCMRFVSNCANIFVIY